MWSVNLCSYLVKLWVLRYFTPKYVCVVQFQRATSRWREGRFRISTKCISLRYCRRFSTFLQPIETPVFNIDRLIAIAERTVIILETWSDVKQKDPFTYNPYLTVKNNNEQVRTWYSMFPYISQRRYGWSQVLTWITKTQRYRNQLSFQSWWNAVQAEGAPSNVTARQPTDFRTTKDSKDRGGGSISVTRGPRAQPFRARKLF